MLIFNFVLCGIYLLTFSHDAVRILVSPELIAGGALNCKTGGLIIVSRTLSVEDNISNHYIKLSISVYPLSCFLWYWSINAPKYFCQSHSSIILYSLNSVQWEQPLKAEFWSLKGLRKQREMSYQYSIICLKIERCSWRMDGSFVQHRDMINSLR